MQFAALEKDADPKTHAEAIGKTFAALPRLGHFGIDGLVAGKSADDSVSLGRLSIDFHDWNKIFAEATDVRVENLKIPREPHAARSRRAPICSTRSATRT